MNGLDLNIYKQDIVSMFKVSWNLIIIILKVIRGTILFPLIILKEIRNGLLNKISTLTNTNNVDLIQRINQLESEIIILKRNEYLPTKKTEVEHKASYLSDLQSEEINMDALNAFMQ